LKCPANWKSRGELEIPLILPKVAAPKLVACASESDLVPRVQTVEFENQRLSSALTLVWLNSRSLQKANAAMSSPGLRGAAQSAESAAASSG
jgi:hypothetical protein